MHLEGVVQDGLNCGAKSCCLSDNWGKDELLFGVGSPDI